jgi:transcriptional regulator with XRE-family HTH domain
MSSAIIMLPDESVTQPILTVEVSTDTVTDVPRLRTLAERLTFARKQRGLGTNELNRLVQLKVGHGVSGGYISSIESGRRKNIGFPYGTAICSALAIRPDWLSDGVEPMEVESGEHIAVAKAAKMHENLRHVLDALNVKGRWHPVTIAMARELPEDMSVQLWPATLDRIEKTIEKLKPLFDR